MPDNQRLAHIFSGKHDALIKAQWHDLGDTWRARVARRIKLRKITDPVFRASCNLRNRLHAALKAKGARKQGLGLIGCTIAVLRAHLESQFTEGMTWQNYGKWHIDHKHPVASFDLLLVAEQRRCFHYTNLRPMWARANQEKGSRKYLG